MTDQPHGDESQDNVGTGAEISTENEVTAIFYEGSDGVPQSGATPSAPAVSSHSSEAETKASGLEVLSFNSFPGSSFPLLILSLGLDVSGSAEPALVLYIRRAGHRAPPQVFTQPAPQVAMAMARHFA